MKWILVLALAGLTAGAIMLVDHVMMTPSLPAEKSQIERAVRALERMAEAEEAQARR